jgi:PAS domain S-box-containing protein
MDMMVGLGVVVVLFLALAFIMYKQNMAFRQKSPVSVNLNKAELADFEVFFSVNIDMLCIADADGYFQVLNPEWERTLGYPLSELVGKRFIEFVHPDDLESTIKASNDLANNKIILNFENRYKHKDGSYRWIEWRSYPANNKIYAAARDITSRKMAEEEMQKSDLWLRESQKNSHIGSYNFNIAEGKWKSSAELDAIFGITSDYDKGILGWMRIIHPDQANEMQDYLLNHVIKNQQPFNKEYRIVRQDSGEVRWVYGMGNLYYDKEGNLEYMIGTIQDITEKKNTEEALIKGEERYRLLFENMTSGFALHEMIYDEDGEPIDFRYLDVNLKFMELWDVNEEIKGKTFNQIFPSAPDEWFRVVNKVVATKEPFSVVRYFPEKGRYADVLNFWAGNNQFASLFNDITDRVNAENALKESESRLRSFINESSEGVVIINEQGFVEEWNNKAAQITGITAYKAQNKYWWDIVKLLYPEEVTPVFGDYQHEMINNILKTGNLHIPAQNIYRLHLSQGEAKYIEQTLFTIKTNLGYRLGVIFNDITERKKTEEALNQERVFTDALLAGVPGLVYMYNEDGLLVRWNKRHETETGYTAEELAHIHLLDWYKDSQTDMDTINAAMARLNSEGFVSAEAYLQKKNGEKTLYYFTAVSTILNGTNYFIGIGIDITEKKKTEELITYERNMLRALIDNITDIVYVKDTESRFLISNRTLSRIVGSTMENMLGKTDLDLFPKDMATNFYNDEHDLLKTGKPIINKEEMVYDAEGNTILFQTNKVPLRNPQGEIMGLVGTGHIITEQKKAETALKKSESILKATMEAMEDGVLVVSSDGVITHSNTQFSRIFAIPSELLASGKDNLLLDHVKQFFNNGEEFDRKVQEIYESGLSVNDILYFNNGRIIERVSYPLETDYQYSGRVWLFRDITERKKAEDEIALNESRLHSMVNIMQKQAGTVNELLDYALEEALRLTQSKIGYIYYYSEAKQEFTLNSWSKDVMKECAIVDPKTCYALDKTGIWGEAVRQRKPIIINNYETSQPLKKGYPEGHAQLKSFLSIPIFNGSEIVAVIGVANKVTDYNNTDVLQLTLLMDTVWKVIQKQRAEQELRLSEQMFSDIFNLSPDMIGIIRMVDSVILMLNPMFVKVTGYLLDEFIGKTPNDLNLWINDHEKQQMFEAIVKTGEVNNMEASMRIKDGSVLICLVSGKKLVFNNEEALIFVVHDITERKETEKLIAYERNMLRTLIDTIPDLVYVKDANCRNIVTNRAASDLLGVSIENMLGKTDTDIHKLDVADQFLTDEQQLMQNGIPVINKEERIFDKDGNEVIVQTTKLPLRDANGIIQGLVGTGHIITEQKRAENEIRKLNEELEKKVEERTLKLQELNKELESFAYSVSHDLRAPLRHVDGFVRLMYSNIASPSENIKSYFEKITNASKRMSGMIDELLTFSRLGRKELALSPVDLNLLINEIIEQIKPDITSRNVTWKINPLTVVPGDRNLLRIAFDNLISNAIKYTSKKEMAIIEIGVASDVSENATVYIKDNGAGFDMAYAEKLFGVFQRLHSPEEFEGIGIGLANVKQIIVKHKGVVYAEGKLNEGATFYIQLPK